MKVTTGDCRDVLRAMPDNSVDAHVCDPPYGLGFMGAGWDHEVPGVEFWAEALRVAKPGAHLVAFGGTRKWHRLWCAVEDAGWEIRDTLMWLYGQGMPHGTDVARVIDARRGDDVRPVCRWLRAALEQAGLTVAAVAEEFECHPRLIDHWAARDTDSQPSCPTWGQWSILTAMLEVRGVDTPPALDAEVARLNERKGQRGDAWADREVIGVVSVALNPGFAGDRYTTPRRVVHELTEPALPEALRWEGWDTTLKPAWEPILLARKPMIGTVAENVLAWGVGALNIDACRIAGGERTLIVKRPDAERDKAATCYGAGINGSRNAGTTDLGRHPANVVIDELAAIALDEASGERPSGRFPAARTANRIYGNGAGTSIASRPGPDRIGESGGASRFFYTAKAARSERNLGVVDNRHPTVKPLALMRWLIRLVTPPGGLVVDMFAGSGTTGVACAREGFSFHGIEIDAVHADTARRRIAAVGAEVDEPEESEIVVREPPRQGTLF